ncbi:ArsR family transcriptional regulator YozA [Streptococcus mutans]|nr:ArsR family transcriptional regulator YozA [Streptococcus mutans]
MDLLKAGKLSAEEIAEQFDLAAATSFNYHKVLKQSDLTLATGEKNFMYYELNTSVLEEGLVWLADLKGSKDDENE